MGPKRRCPQPKDSSTREPASKKARSTVLPLTPLEETISEALARHLPKSGVVAIALDYLGAVELWHDGEAAHSEILRLAQEQTYRERCSARKERQECWVAFHTHFVSEPADIDWLLLGDDMTGMRQEARLAKMTAERCVLLEQRFRSAHESWQQALQAIKDHTRLMELLQVLLEFSRSAANEKAGWLLALNGELLNSARKYQLEIRARGLALVVQPLVTVRWSICEMRDVFTKQPESDSGPQSDEEFAEDEYGPQSDEEFAEDEYAVVHPPELLVGPNPVPLPKNAVNARVYRHLDMRYRQEDVSARSGGSIWLLTACGFICFAEREAEIHSIFGDS